MIIACLFVFGLAVGSFVNAFVWRLHEQSKPRARRVADNKELSIISGRSMCPTCQHPLAWYDLVPVISWLSLRGKCRYCHKAISWQYPLVELATVCLFMVSYIFWPAQLNTPLSLALFIFWLIFLTFFVALAVYDMRWMLLPDRVVRPLQLLAVVYVLIQALGSKDVTASLGSAFWGIVCLAGLFYALFQISKGKWIGGGDVKLAVVLGLLVGGPLKALLVIFFASAMGSIVGLPLLFGNKTKAKMRIAFGPFLITATIIVYLFGTSLVAWYKSRLLLV